MYDINKALLGCSHKRFLGQFYLSLIPLITKALQALTDSQPSDYNTKKMLYRFFDFRRKDMKSRHQQAMEEFLQMAYDARTFIYSNGNREHPVSDELMTENGYSMTKFKESLWTFAEFASEAFDRDISEGVATFCGKNPDARNVLSLDEMHKLGEDAIIGNEMPSRVPLAFVVDNGFYMSQIPGGMEALNDRLRQLFKALNNDSWISLSTDVYLTTTGCGPEGYVREQNERIDMGSVNVLYDDVLRYLDIKPCGKSYIVPAIRAAIRALENILKAMRECPTPVRPYRPWLVVLTDGGFRDSDEDIAALAGELRERTDSHSLVVQLHTLTDVSPEALERVGKLGPVSKINRIEEFFANIHQSFRSLSDKTPDYEVNMTYDEEL